MTKKELIDKIGKATGLVYEKDYWFEIGTFPPFKQEGLLASDVCVEGFNLCYIIRKFGREIKFKHNFTKMKKSYLKDINQTLNWSFLSSPSCLPKTDNKFTKD